MEEHRMTSEETPALRPILLVLAAMFAFSLMAWFTRAAAADTLGIAAWRAIIVAVVFAASAMLREGGAAALRPDSTTLKLGLWLGLALAIASTTFVGGYALTTIPNTIFLHNLAPVFVFPLAWWLFKERSGTAAITGGVIALFGVGMMFWVSLFQASHFASSRFLLGDLLAFISAIGYAAVLVLTRLTRQRGTPILGTLFVAWTFAAVLTSVAALLSGGLAVSMTSLLWIFGLAVVSTNIPFYLLNLGMKHITAGTASVLSLSEVLFATILGYGAYNEQLAPIGWMGASLAAIGVLYAVTQRGRETTAAPEHAATLPSTVRRSRLVRSGLGLVLLNLGALGTVAGTSSVSPVVALVGLAILARHGPGLGFSLLEGRFEAAVRWAGAGMGLAIAWTAWQWAGNLQPAASLAWGLAGIGVVLFDRLWAAKEPESDRDEQPLLQLAIGLLGLSLLLQAMNHGMAGVSLEAANLLIGVQGLAVLLASIAGTSTGTKPGLPTLEAHPAAWMRGRKPLFGVAVIWAMGAIHTVPTGHVGIVERFGAPVKQTSSAGIVLHLPPPIETVTDVNIGAEQQLDIGEHTLLTGDQSLITLRSVIRFAITDPNAHAYGFSAPNAALVELAKAALVSVVSGEAQDGLLTDGRAQVETKVKQALQYAVGQAGLGIEVSDLHLTHVTVPAPVMAAFLDVITADEERQERINTAEAYEADLLPRTRGEAIARISTAQGDAERIDAKAIGFDVWFRSIQRNGAAAPRLTRVRLAAETVESTLSTSRLIAAPKNVRVWLGGEGHWPRDPTLAEEP